MADYNLTIIQIKISRKDNSLMSRLHNAFNADCSKAVFKKRVLKTSENQKMLNKE